MSDPQDVVRGFVKAWNSKQAEEIRRLMATDAHFTNIYGKLMNSPAEIERAHAGAFQKGLKEAELTITELRTHRQTTELAYVECAYRIDGAVLREDGEKQSSRGRLSFLLEKQNERWLIAAAQNTERPMG
ncbi:YybH family protein [Parvularcula maris]|uniref:SgcJ/EcaC family oxidoreductase n=1 Tax=Parvularcula maris TaxID=2965077 RepID=A0A9X2RJH6_9PROT|nr:SgcJ/EcaC family oxidoreductase [Parvularcula maris]